ncbi:MAG TPA: type II secretion system F family protein [Opitutaceae bacterium]|nr:type II secretion system F family protein [Opitutaceae bacterium]
MPRFSFTARDRSGQSVASTIEAPSRKEALRLLTARGLQPTQVDEAVPAKPASTRRGKSDTAATVVAPAAASSRANRPLRRGAPKLTRRERLPFLNALVDLIASGLSAGEAVRLLALRIQEPALRALCTGLWDRLSEGAPLSRAMSDFPTVFDTATINLIQAGEATGSLNEVLGRIISHLTEQRELKRQLTAALAYPIFMVCVASGVILFFLFFLLPRLQALLNSLGGHLPLSTRILVGISDFSLHYGIFIAGGAILGAIAFWRWRHTTAGREATDAWILKLPLFGPFAVSRSVLAFSQTLSVLLENGITAADALRMTERQIGNVIHRRAFNEATARVLEGEALSTSLQRTDCFPALVLDQLSVGENTGNVVPSLKKISVAYQKNITGQLNVFTRVIASGVLLAVFVFVGFIAFAIVSAVFQLSASFKIGG